MAAKLVWTIVLLAGAVVSADTLGSIASIEQFPSLAQVEKEVSLTWIQQCAANILTNRHVVSTASCLKGTSSIYRTSDIQTRIRVGSTYRNTGGEVLAVSQVTVHYDYGLLGYDADIAVALLSDYLTFGATVQQGPILGQGIILPFGLLVQNAGWGTTAEGGEYADDNLYSVDLLVHDSDSCLNAYIGSQFVTENMFCAGLSYYGGRDFDQLDSGAPLYYQNTLVGILSFGKQANDEYPAVATNIGSYTEWIIGTTGTV